MRKIKINWKTLLIIVGSFLLVLAMLGGFSVFAKDSVKVAGIGEWKLGDLDPETGKYVKSEQAIYIKDKFECYGLRVEPDFESTVTYDVYYYNEDDILIEKKLGLTDVYSSKNEHAQYARLVIHPEIPEDVEKDEFKISYFDIVKYASKLNVTVFKEDSKYGDFTNLHNVDLERENTVLKYNSDTAKLVNGFEVSSGANVNSKCFNDVKVDGSYDYYDIFVYIENDEKASVSQFGIFNGVDTDAITPSDRFVNTAGLNKPVWIKMTLKTPDLESYENCVLGGIVPNNSVVYVYGYNK